MKKILILILSAVSYLCYAQSTSGKDYLSPTSLPVRGFCIAAPLSKNVDEFVKFINEELGPRLVNTLILRVDYNYRYESHPELRDSDALSRNDVKKIVAACRKSNIRVIPQVNLLGHQSWAG
ncbi:MAG TPA: hypothetical protein VJ963_06640, partial [Bacteroidales bacterium]|nr:hypothetical protein [Bacteroidales bacterium]